MSKSKIGTIEAIFTVITIVIGHSILSLPRDLISNTKSSTILNIVFITIIAILISLLIYKLMKNFNGLDIIDISEYAGGKVFKSIIGTIFIFYFMFCTGILLRNFCEGLHIVYFQMTDIMFIILLFIIGICISNYLGFNSSIKANLIIIPAALVSILVIFITNFKNFDSQKIFPILGDGLYNTFVYGLLNLVSFQGIIFLYLIPPLLKEPEKFKKIALTSTLLTGIYIIISVSIILFMFPAFSTTNEIMPMYSAARYISFGTFLQRLESIFMLIWIIAFLSYSSISCKFSIEIFQKITNIKDYKPLITIFGILLLAISLFPKNLAQSFLLESKVYVYLTIGIVFVLGLLVLIIANIKKRRESR